jgi:hypothetical protein
MLGANSVTDILNALNLTLGETTEYIPRPARAGEIGLMVPGMPSESKVEWVPVTRQRWSKLIGILFCMPMSPLGREEILPGLDYFHRRSGSFVDFFCVGYGAYWPDAVPKVSVVATIGDTRWLYSVEMFNTTRGEVEQLAEWSFSGETDLILAVARRTGDAPAQIDFSTAIACNLEQMVRDGAITSVRSFFEKIFKFGETCKGSDPVHEFSDKMGARAAGNFLLEAVLKLVPEALGDAYRSTRHFAIRDISR